VRWCKEKFLQGHFHPLEPLQASGVVENSVGRECKESFDLYYSEYRMAIGKRVDA